VLHFISLMNLVINISM